jgi:hypothetical protein
VNKLKELDSGLFTSENYKENWLILFNLQDTHGLSDILDIVEKHALGFCDLGELVEGTNQKNYRVLFEKNGQRFWFYLDKTRMDLIIYTIETRRG